MTGRIVQVSGSVINVEFDEGQMPRINDAPKVCVPMHYRQGKLGYDVISELPDFLNFFGKNEVVFLSTNTVTDQHLEKGLVLVPKYPA